MIFLTYWFVCFAAGFLALYVIVRHPIARLALLLVACGAFYWHFAGPSGVVPIAGLAVVTYLAGLSRRRWAYVAAIVLCAAALVFYKYTRFLIDGVVGSLSGDWAASAAAWIAPVLPAAAPLGISFFTFEFVHYLYDVMRGDRAIRRPWDFAAFAAFWPSSVAGPVKRYQQFLPALTHGLTSVGSTDVVLGLLRICVGLVKKWVADYLTGYIGANDATFETQPAGTRWAVFLAIGLRILFDFSGYSDMAIGFARMMGITLPENFNWPYLARNLADFWQRWHISLSLWIRDYIYIPLGGNRYGMPRRIVNGLLAFAICGLWHGPAWHFVIWGLWHGAGLAVVTGFRAATGRGSGGGAAAFWAADGGSSSRRALRLVTDVVSWAVTMIFVWVGWLIFFYPLDRALVMLGSLLATLRGA
jgi:alginate O-acetyltransferase complex protein AlgI